MRSRISVTRIRTSGLSPENVPILSRDLLPRIEAKIRKTWTKLTNRDIALYIKGKREKFLLVLQRKYSFNSTSQAENTLSCIERLESK